MSSLFDLQEQLARFYRQWENTWPDTLQWRKRQAWDAKWWDVAASVCRAEGIPPALLIFVCHNYLNARPADPEVRFSATVLRSESLIYRSVANFRMRVGELLRQLTPVYTLWKGEAMDVPRPAVEAARLAAELSCRYFEHMLDVAAYPLEAGGQVIQPVVFDTLAYRWCERNPFLLLRAARTARVRALAAVNCWLLADRQPWHAAIWEGVCSPFSLSLPEAMAGGPVGQFYEEGRLCRAWPTTINTDRLFSQLNDQSGPPELHLLQPRLCERTEMFLTLKLEAARKGEEGPGWGC